MPLLHSDVAQSWRPRRLSAIFPRGPSAREIMDRGITHSDRVGALTSPELQLIYETAPIGLAFLSTDCRYLLINQHLTEICGISVAEHIGRTVRETVPDLAEQVENIVQTVLRTGEPVVGIEVNGQRPDKQNAERFWTTNWHPL